MPAHDVGWIVTGRRPFDEFSVGSLVPVAFDRYARMLHPAWAASGRPVRWATVAAWSGREVHSLAQWEFLAHPIQEPVAPAPFVAAPDTGGLPPGHFAALRSLLVTHTSSADHCFFGMWEGCGRRSGSAWSGAPVLMLDQRTFLVRRGSIDAALAADSQSSSPQLVARPPTLLWPADRAWFVASDPDQDSTYVGGSASLIESLLASPDLEAWPVEADDWVAIGSDEINASAIRRDRA